MDAKFEAFHQDYVGKVQQEYLENINTASALLERANSAVTVCRKNAKVAAAVVAREANNNKYTAQMTTINAQLEESKEDAAEAVDMLSTLQTNIETKEEGWTIRSIIIGLETL